MNRKPGDQVEPVSPDPPPSITRARDAEPDEIIEQIDEIESMMLAGKWVPGKSLDDLATRWGCKVALVGKRAAEAGRRIRKAVDPEAVTGAIVSSLDMIVKQATTDKRPNYQAAVSALELRAKVLGLVTTKVDMKQDMKGLSDAELQARIDAEIAARSKT